MADREEMITTKKGSTFFSVNITKFHIVMGVIAAVISLYLGLFKGVDVVVRPIVKEEIQLASARMRESVDKIHEQYVQRAEFVEWTAEKTAKWEEQERTNARVEQYLQRIEANQVEILKRLPR